MCSKNSKKLRNIQENSHKDFYPSNHVLDKTKVSLFGRFLVHPLASLRFDKPGQSNVHIKKLTQRQAKGLRVEFLLKTDSGYPRDAELSLFTLANPESSLCFLSFLGFEDPA